MKFFGSENPYRCLPSYNSVLQSGMWVSKFHMNTLPPSSWLMFCNEHKGCTVLKNTWHPAARSHHVI